MKKLLLALLFGYTLRRTQESEAVRLVRRSFGEIAIPYLKDMIRDMIYLSVDRALYGERPSPTALRTRYDIAAQQQRRGYIR